MKRLRELVLDVGGGVLGLFAGVLHGGLELVGLAFVLQVVVTGDVSGGFFRLARSVLLGVVELVCDSHESSLANLDGPPVVARGADQAPVHQPNTKSGLLPPLSAGSEEFVE